MLSGREPPARWPVGLADLGSRLAATPVARLEPPDDALLGAVLVKLFADRQLAVAPDLVQYLVPRIERSFAAAEAVVAALDRAGLARRRPVTARLAAEVLRRGVSRGRWPVEVAGDRGDHRPRSDREAARCSNWPDWRPEGSTPTS